MEEKCHRIFNGSWFDILPARFPSEILTHSYYLGSFSLSVPLPLSFFLSLLLSLPLLVSRSISHSLGGNKFIVQSLQSNAIKTSDLLFKCFFAKITAIVTGEKITGR